MIGRPSAALADEMAKEEETRLSDQCKRLGEQGLKGKEEELQKAMTANEVKDNVVLGTVWCGGDFLSICLIRTPQIFLKIIIIKKEIATVWL